MNGVLIIDKPQGLTSHDVVNRVRRILGERSVGHLGTLDPSATGVLPMVVGSFTRLAQFYAHSEKTYEGVIRFGFSTDTYDADGEATSTARSVILNATEVEALAAEFRGTLEQTPPPFSAKKIGGVPAYKLARKQREVQLQPVRVEIEGVRHSRCGRRSRHLSCARRIGDLFAVYRARHGKKTRLRRASGCASPNVGRGVLDRGRTPAGRSGIGDAAGNS